MISQDGIANTPGRHGLLRHTKGLNLAFLNLQEPRTDVSLSCWMFLISTPAPNASVAMTIRMRPFLQVLKDAPLRFYVDTTLIAKPSSVICWI